MTDVPFVGTGSHSIGSKQCLVVLVPWELVGTPIGPWVVHDLGAAHGNERGFGGNFNPVQDI